MSTVIVTGGAGFIGSNLCERLLEENHEVVCVDNLCTGSRKNIWHLDGHSGFTFLEADVRLPLAWAGKADYVFHLASPASPVAYFRMPVETATINALGTHAMLELAYRWGARFLLASTSEVYGDPLRPPQREDYWGNVNPIGPRSCYDEGKRFAEALSVNYQREFGMDVRIIRIFNTYGPPSDPEDGRIVPSFIRQALQGLPITVFGSGLQTRSLCYVDDLVEGLMLAMFSPGAENEVINLGSPDERSVMEYALLIKEVCGSTSEIQMCQAREEEPSRRCPDISRARKRLGWEPRTPLRSGLSATVSWFRERLLIGEGVYQASERGRRLP